MIRTITAALFRRLAVRANVHVGRELHVGPGSVIWAPRRLVIGDNVYLGKGVTIQVDGSIGDNVLIANAVGIVGRTDHDFRQIGVPVRESSWVGDCPDQLSRRTVIGSDVWIGYGAIVLSGVTIGDSSIVAAGALVTEDVADNAVVAGSPARFRHHRFTEADFDEHWRRLAARGLHRLNLTDQR